MERLKRLVIKSKAGSYYLNDAAREVMFEPHEIGAHQRRLLLERLHAYEDTDLTPEQIRELAERDTAKAPEEIQDAYGDTRLICPNCRNSVINYFNRSRPPQFCMICGQRLKIWRVKSGRNEMQELEKNMNILRNHMNDGWISVEERLPEEPPEEVDDEDNLEEYIVTIEGAEKPTILRYAGDGTWWEDGTYYPVIAWRHLPEPYRTERSEGE